MKALGDTREPQAHIFLRASVDLSWQVLGHAAGSAAMIEGRLGTALLPVQRAVFEALANLRFLVAHPNRNFEATVFQAYSYLKDIEDFPTDVPLVEERKEILGRMPAEVVANAKRRLKDRPHTWSGKNLSTMARQGGLGDFEALYGFLSGRAHASRIGYHVRFGAVTGDQQEVQFSMALPEGDVEVHANFTRLALHSAFRALWSLVDSPRLVVPTPDPGQFKKFRTGPS
jgi:hypothetical protein